MNTAQQQKRQSAHNLLVRKFVPYQQAALRFEKRNRGVLGFIMLMDSFLVTTGQDAFDQSGYNDALSIYNKFIHEELLKLNQNQTLSAVFRNHKLRQLFKPHQLLSIVQEELKDTIIPLQLPQEEVDGAININCLHFTQTVFQQIKNTGMIAFNEPVQEQKSKINKLAGQFREELLDLISKNNYQDYFVDKVRLNYEERINALVDRYNINLVFRHFIIKYLYENGYLVTQQKMEHITLAIQQNIYLMQSVEQVDRFMRYGCYSDLIQQVKDGECIIARCIPGFAFNENGARLTQKDVKVFHRGIVNMQQEVFDFVYSYRFAHSVATNCGVDVENYAEQILGCNQFQSILFDYEWIVTLFQNFYTIYLVQQQQRIVSIDTAKVQAFQQLTIDFQRIKLKNLVQQMIESNDGKVKALVARIQEYCDVNDVYLEDFTLNNVIGRMHDEFFCKITINKIGPLVEWLTQASNALAQAGRSCDVGVSDVQNRAGQDPKKRSQQAGQEQAHAPQSTQQSGSRRKGVKK